MHMPSFHPLSFLRISTEEILSGQTHSTIETEVDSFHFQKIMENHVLYGKSCI